MQTRTFTITTDSSYPLLASDVKYALEFTHGFGPATKLPEYYIVEEQKAVRNIEPDKSWKDVGDNILAKFNGFQLRLCVIRHGLTHYVDIKPEVWQELLKLVGIK